MPEVSIPGVGLVTFPYDMPPEQIAAQAQRLYAEAQGKEAPLTRERQPAGTPSALSAGHHPDSSSREMFGQRVPGIEEVLQRDDVTPSDAAFLKRGPEIGGAAGMMLGGPLGAGVGAAAGSLVKGQAERGAHMPTGGEAGQAALDGGLSALLAGAPRALAAGARTIGPAVAKHAGALSKGVSAISGIGAGIASGNPLMGLGAGAAARTLTSPGAIRTAGNVAGRAGAAVPAHAANKAGFGLLSAEAFRKALLDALGAEPSASTVP
jgi:hypothetical protein